MPKPKVLALVMAGGEGSRLELLTERRAKPALPCAGVYRLEVVGDGRLSGFHIEVFAFRTGLLLDTLDELAVDGELQDFGHGLLSRLVEAGEAVEHRMAGYWRDAGTVPAYWQAHLDLLDPERPLDLDDPGRGLGPTGRALVSPGTVVAGEVTRSVLGQGVVVEPGAVVREAVLLDDCVVAAGAWSSGRSWTAASGSAPGGAVVAPGGRFANHGHKEAAS
jgi:ADP-glucose pyrophosphorylase